LLRPQKNEIVRSSFRLLLSASTSEDACQRNLIIEVRCREEARRIYLFQLYLQREVNEGGEASILARTVAVLIVW
jgi:hypothetical protein